MKSALIFVAVFAFVNLVQCEDSKAPLVELEKQGKLEGIFLTSRKGENYFGFLGVPYGKIPERFAVPEPAEPWEGTKTVKTLPPNCIHLNVFVKKFIGNEQCLVLNVYTKTVDPNAKLPVIVFNTPGGFQFGGASMYEANYIIDEGVVFVSINNRLGALGFLNTGDGVVSGNMGLKDQVLALKWVQQHIHKFGGDPNSVTFVGESAAGASVEFHMLSPMSKGLFHRGISQSGSALNPWALQQNPKENARRFAEFANCSRDTSEETVKCLREKEPEEIIKAQLKLSDLSPEFNLISMQFVPSVESAETKGPKFLTDTPYALLKRGEIVNKVPWIAGLTENEGAFFTALASALPKTFEKLNMDWAKLAPEMLYYNETVRPEDRNEVSQGIFDFYFGGQNASVERKSDFSDIFSERFFANGIVKALKLHAKHQPVYTYLLDYKAKNSVIQFVFGEAVKNRDGFTHGDELQFMFNKVLGMPEVELGTEDGDFSEKFLKLWVSFAKEGKPTATWGSEKEWNPVEPEDKVPITFYELSKDTGLVKDPFVIRRAFWEGLPLAEHEKTEE